MTAPKVKDETGTTALGLFKVREISSRGISYNISETPIIQSYSVASDRNGT